MLLIARYFAVESLACFDFLITFFIFLPLLSFINLFYLKYFFASFILLFIVIQSVFSFRLAFTTLSLSSDFLVSIILPSFY